MQNYNKVQIQGVDIDTRVEGQIKEIVSSFLDGELQHKIYTPNPEFIVEVVKNSEFRDVLNKADINLPDGIGLLFASKFLSLPNRFIRNKKLNRLYTYWQAFYCLLSLIFYPSFCREFITDRICGSDFFWDVVDMCAKKSKRVFLLGARPGVAEVVRDRLLKVYPKLQIAGTYAGIPDSESEKEICHIINTGKPDVLFVAYGAPAQEFWIDRSIEKMPSVKVAMGVGGTFDFVAGVAKRAPTWMKKLGLEWLFRLVISPSRVKRIYNATVKFVLVVIGEKIEGIKN